MRAHHSGGFIWPGMRSLWERGVHLVRYEGPVRQIREGGSSFSPMNAHQREGGVHLVRYEGLSKSGRLIQTVITIHMMSFPICWSGEYDVISFM